MFSHYLTVMVYLTPFFVPGGGIFYTMIVPGLTGPLRVVSRGGGEGEGGGGSFMMKLISALSESLDS